MKYLLLSPHFVGATANAGWNFITAGIRDELSRRDEHSTFDTFDGFFNEQWPDAEFFRQFDCVVVCGNPRYSLSDGLPWMYVGMFSQLLTLRKECGFKVIDAYQGAGAPLGLDFDEAAEALAGNEANRKVGELLRAMDAEVITRDGIAQRVNEIWGLPSVQKPCSSFAGALTFPPYSSHIVGPPRSKIGIAKNMDGYAGGAELLRTLALHYEVIATCLEDAEFCARENIPFILIYTPRFLVTLYSQADEVISFRLHAAIPAKACGAKRVCYLAIDSRGETCRAFDIPFGDYRDGVRFDG
jgi:hypothetical protein